VNLATKQLLDRRYSSPKRKEEDKHEDQSAVGMNRVASAKTSYFPQPAAGRRCSPAGDAHEEHLREHSVNLDGGVETTSAILPLHDEIEVPHEDADEEKVEDEAAEEVRVAEDFRHEAGRATMKGEISFCELQEDSSSYS
jgi:hypothetical protein